jgi:HAE1 family hydrophobic/amphiphilic exporter-1
VGALERWYGRRIAVTAVLAFCVLVSAYLILRVRVGPSGDLRGTAYAVEVEHFGVDAEEIERAITRPLEDALSVIPGIREIRSISDFGLSRVTVSFDPGDGGAEASLALRDSVQRVERGLPPSAQKPRIFSSAEAERPVFVASAQSRNMSAAELRQWVERVVKPAFEKIPGAGEVEVGGGEVREIHVLVDPARALQRGLTLPEVALQLQRQNLLLPAGRLDSAKQEIPVSVQGRLEGMDDLTLLDLALPKGGTARLSELAAVTYGVREQETISRVNGSSMIVLAVRSSGSANLISLSKDLRREALRWARDGLSFDVILDRGEAVEQGVYQIIYSLLAGLGIVTLLLPVVAGELRRLIVLSLAVPLTLVITVAIFSLAGIGLDPYVLCGLAVGIGTIIDTGVIVGEQAGIREVRAITPSLFSSLVTALIVLAPLLFAEFASPGIRQVAFAIALLLIVSFGVNILFLPAFIHACGSPRSLGPLIRVRARLGSALSRPARRLLHLLTACSMEKRYAIIGGALLLTAGAGASLITMGKDFSPSTAEGSLSVHVEMEPGQTVDATDAEMDRFLAPVRTVAGVEMVESIARRGSGDVEIRFAPKLVSRERLSAQVKAFAARMHAGFAYLPEGDAPGQRRMEIAILGDDVVELRKAAHETALRISEEPWASQVVLNFKDPAPTLLVEVDSEKAAGFGVRAAEIATTLRWALHGPVALKWLERDHEIDLRVMETGARSADRESLARIPIRSRQGAVTSLASLAAIRDGAQGGAVFHKNRQRALFLTVHGDAPSLDVFVDRIWEALRTVHLPKGYAFELDRAVEELQNSFAALWLALSLAVVFVYIVLAALSESLVAPLLILSVVPTSLAFPLIAYRLLGEPLRIPALVGQVMLCGMVVSNSILVVDEMRARLPGAVRAAAIRAAAIRAVRKRIRPLLITSGATILGTLPLVFSGAVGEGFMTALAFVVFWGILGSLVSTLVIVPALARVFPHWLARKEAR